MHAEAGAIEVVGGMEETVVGGGKRRAKPPPEFQTATGGNGAISVPCTLALQNGLTQKSLICCP